MDKYAQTKNFHSDHQPQVYMYAFMYVYPDTMPKEEYFSATNIFIENCKNFSTLTS